MRVGVVVASLGRAHEVDRLLFDLSRQTLTPHRVLLSLEQRTDAPLRLGPAVEVVHGPRGLCAQRNRGLALLRDDCDIVVFFDDDFVPSATAIAGIADAFEVRPAVAGLTGLVLADGVTDGGIEYDDARAIADQWDAEAAQRKPAEFRPTRSAYGCNMAFRCASIEGLWFDERLPLYGWQEDVDFAGRVVTRGEMMQTDAFAGVHCGVTRGRMPGTRLGYSQIANPLYLIRKGTMGARHGYSLLLRNTAANHVRALAPEPHIDRLGRLRGNWLAFGHLLRGRLDPSHVLEL